MRTAPLAFLTALAAAAPAAAQISTPVPTVDMRTLSPAEIARRNALYGPGWQYRMAPISPGRNAGVPINPAVEVAPADLSNLDQRIRTDEVVMTRLRDSESARENGVVAAVEPALPFPRYDRNVVFGRHWPAIHPVRWVKSRF